MLTSVISQIEVSVFLMCLIFYLYILILILFNILQKEKNVVDNEDIGKEVEKLKNYLNQIKLRLTTEV